MGIVYFKDRFAEENECHISLNDRAFRFGDGLFETLLVAGGRIFDMESHLERLRTGLEAFRFAALDVSALPVLCQEIVKRNALENGYVRIIVSRGSDAEPAGYKIGKSVPYFILQTTAKPYPPLQEIRLWRSSYTAAFKSPAKSHSALTYVLAMQEAAEHGCDNALLLDAHRHICETASGNIFWIKDSTLYTPSTELPMVPGTIRKKILSLWDGKVDQGRFTVEMLVAADEIFMSNTGVIIAPVIVIDPLGIRLKAGPRTRSLRVLLDDEIRGK